MEHPDDPAGQNEDEFRHGDGNSELQTGHNGTPSAPPETVLPPTIFMSGLGDGGLFLQGWPVGLHIYLSPEDALPLRRELEAVFADDPHLPRGDQGWSL